MDNDALTTHFLDQSDAWTRDTIDRRGWALQYVFGDGEHDPPFCYTIGLHGLGHPELVVFGLDQQSAGSALNDLGDRIRGGATLVEGELVSFAEWPCRLHVLALPNAAEILFSANRFYGRADDDPVAALQLVWDDRGGHFPWEPDYEPPGWLQPLPGTFRA